jgi:radical SAM superfamily enzyme YgiQ (UPF0313 family)
MAKAKFTAVLLGIETPSQEILDRAHKGTTIAQAERVVRNLHRHDIAVWGTFTVGFPGEGRPSIRRTMAYARKLDIDITQLAVVTPIPGSEIYDEMVAKGMIENPDWDDYDFTVPNIPGQMPRRDMELLLREGYFRAYCRPGYLIRALGPKSRNINRVRSRIFLVLWNLIRGTGLSVLKSKLGLATVEGAEWKHR